MATKERERFGVLPTRQHFEAYERVRQSGITNMFDVGTVSRISGLNREEILEVMENYRELNQKYPEVRASGSPSQIKAVYLRKRHHKYLNESSNTDD